MVYKLANISDLNSLPPIDQRTWDMLYEFTSVLTHEYGAERDIHTDDGGYVLYAPSGTPCEEIKAYFDYTAHTIEYANRDLTASPPQCAAMFILSNEYAVVIVMSIDDAPAEITDAFEDGY